MLRFIGEMVHKREEVSIRTFLHEPETENDAIHNIRMNSLNYH